MVRGPVGRWAGWSVGHSSTQIRTPTTSPTPELQPPNCNPNRPPPPPPSTIQAEYDAYDTSYWTTSEIANGINDFIVCVEMLGFAIAHIYVFTPNDYVRAERMSVHIGHKDEESYLTTTSHGDSDLFDEDPEMHVTGKRVTGGFQSQRQHILRQLIQGVNFFDLMNDVKVRGEPRAEPKVHVGVRVVVRVGVHIRAEARRS